MKSQIRLSGSGGQGLILAGIILAEAATLKGKQVLQSQSYGPESRGGKSRSDVIIDDKTIYFAHAVDLDILLSLTQEAADEYIPMLKNSGIFIYDSENVRINPLENEAIGIPFSKIALDELKTVMAVNIITLGFIAKITNLITQKDLENVITKKIRKKFVDLDLKAVKLGFKLGKKYLEEEKR
ncbi:MAG: 2-oxoacid:acceptor oxidoreductase family protein [Candidatus Cloacimonadota bacterium]|nr:2-oxoacid:acceptor oxidoreductase family protein [Candidatus Cloacimonadota bacterium]